MTRFVCGGVERALNDDGRCARLGEIGGDPLKTSRCFDFRTRAERPGGG
jgi:hypothetical protein